MKNLVRKPMVVKNKPQVHEDIERHEELNPKLFDAEQNLRSDVSEKVLEIVDAFVKNLAESEIKIIVKDIILIGSNVSYNYTKDSDLDIHIVADTSELDYPPEIYDKLYSAFRSLFNSKFDIKFFGIPVEIYVETDNVPRVSSGVYSVLQDTWLKKPSLAEIPEIDKEAFEKAFASWAISVPEMLKTAESAQEVEDYIADIYAQRQLGLTKPEGEYSIPNLIFKEIRNRGWLDDLKDLKNELKTSELSLEALSQKSRKLEEFDRAFGALDKHQTAKYSRILSEAANKPVTVTPMGYFSITGLTEQMVKELCAKLTKLRFVESLSQKSNGYDLTNNIELKVLGRHKTPKQSYSISGKVIID